LGFAAFGEPGLDHLPFFGCAGLASAAVALAAFDAQVLDAEDEVCAF